MVQIDLIPIYQKDENDILNKLNEKFVNTNIKNVNDFNLFDEIEFNGGYNNDIRYKSKILGFDENENIYILWDCYWFPIKVSKERNIVKFIS